MPDLHAPADILFLIESPFAGVVFFFLGDGLFVRVVEGGVAPVLFL